MNLALMGEEIQGEFHVEEKKVLYESQNKNLQFSKEINRIIGVESRRLKEVKWNLIPLTCIEVSRN